jgi:hypothetical protein
MAKSRTTSDAFARLAAAEARFLESEFLAPVLLGGRVQIRIAGVVCVLQIQPCDFTGWGVFRPTSSQEAKLVRTAKMAERQRYLELFPLVRLILVGQQDNQWYAIPAHRGDARFELDGAIPVRFVEDGQLFEVIETRFDGAQFWFVGPDSRWNPATARYLREELNRQTHPDRLDRPGLTPEERTAYAMRFAMTEEARRHREEVRLREALSHAGAELKEFVERQDVYTVTYLVDGERHVSAVSKNDLSVQVAGICLSGEDANFDLQSLVGVIREAQGGHVVRVGEDNGGLDEDRYWQIHPRR